jgi:nitrogen regulatory protein P-II 1
VVEEIVTEIQSKIATGMVGDGKIFIRSMENAIRIRTGERGDKAL